jgi:uncharacterized membrane protein
MFEFLAVLIAIVAILMVRNAGKRIAQLEQRAAALEQRIAHPFAAESAPEAAHPTEPPLDTFEPAPAAAAASPAERMDEAAIDSVIQDGVPADSPPAAPAEAPAPARSFEERFGASWVVWIGGIALALGGIFLVQYSIEAGLIGPAVRITLGALLAAALIAAGEWTRQRDQAAGFAGLPSAHIPSILTAAGTTVAYAVIYAAYTLYGFLGPASAFILLGLVALATLTASLLHGPALAALGQIGAFLAPLLVASSLPNYWALYIYLAVVTGASFALARARLWRWLAITAVVFGTLWMFPGITDFRVDSLTPHAFHAVVGFALAAALLVSGLFYGPDAEPGRIDEVSSGALAAYLFAAFVLVIARQHDTLALTAFTLLTAATVAIAWRTEAAVGAIPFAGVFAALVIAHWAVEVDWRTLVVPGGATSAAIPDPGRAFYGAHLALGFAFAALFAAAGFLAQGRSPRAEPPIAWAGTAVLVPLAILVALYYRIYGFERSIPFAAIALLIAALFALATDLLMKREPRPGFASAAAIFATGAIAALALALTLALEKGWLTVALALMVPGTAYVAEKRPLPWLRWLCAVLVAAVMLRIGRGPLIVGDDVGETPVFNWLLYGYGVPALAFWLAGWLLRRRADDVPARMTDAAAMLFTVLTAFLQIRHYVNGGDIYYNSADLTEVALQVCVALALTIGLERIRLRTGSIIHDVAAQMLAAFSLAGIVLGLVLIENPWLTGADVGGLFWNLILLGYAIPAILVAALGLMTRPTRPELYRTVAAVTAVGLAMLYLSLEVSRFYHGPVLSEGSVGDAEQYTYSAVWLAFGVVLLVVGIFLRSQPVRLCSAAVVLITVAKVFLLDMAGLTGVWRAFSFIGLGLVLVGIGRVYQLLLFAKKPPAPPAAEAAT